MPKIVLTRKIQLLLDEEDLAQRHEYRQRLYDWQQNCRFAANFICSHLYVQERIKDFFYLADDVRVKLTDRKKSPDGILVTSRQNTTYQLLSKKFKGNMPMSALSILNDQLVKAFQRDKKEYQMGTRSLRTYKRELPIPISPRDICKFINEDGIYKFRLFGIPFKTYLGHDINDKRLLLERFMNKEVQLCASAIGFDKGGKDNKQRIFLLASFEYQQDQKYKLNSNVVAEVHLSVDVPIVVTVNERSYEIGNKEEFLYPRLAIQQAISRIKKGARYNRSGHGRAKKTKALKKFQFAETNYTNNKLHLYSRRLIDLCLKNGAGRLLLANYSELSGVDSLLLLNLNYGALKEKILYKAQKVGIEVIVE